MNNIAILAALVAANHNLRTNIEMSTRKVEKDWSWTEQDEDEEDDESE